MKDINRNANKYSDLQMEKKKLMFQIFFNYFALLLHDKTMY